MNKRNFTANAFQILVILMFVLGLTFSAFPAQAKQAYTPDTLALATKRVFLPFVKNGSASNLPLMAGIMPGWPSDETIEDVMKPLDAWVTGKTGGRSTSIFGTFLNISHYGSTTVEIPLTNVWEAGYTPFINLGALSGDTAYDVATSSKYGDWITNWAKSYKNYANGGKRFAYIAPLQEMNGYWVSYSGSPTNYKLAYKRFQDIFAQVGVPAESVKWVFAPNGWSKPGQPLFEAYYPGDTNVDVVAISAYNFGYCNDGTWKEPEIIYNNPTITDGFYLDRLRALAPSKPIFIAQSATSSYRNPGVKNPAEKDRWLRDAYKYLANQQNVRAIIYFNIYKVCDWEIFKDGVGTQGYKDGVKNNGYKYISPAELLATDHQYR